jgi:DNA-directed RNA polymerase subunit RPC12/RpoP
METFEWTVDHYLARQEARCPVCEFRILIGEKVDRSGDVVSHVRCRIGAPIEATDAIFAKIMETAERQSAPGGPAQPPRTP